MSARRRAASWAQKRAIANPFHAEMAASPPKDDAISLTRSTRASSPGTISAVPIATPPLAIARRVSFAADVTVEPHSLRKDELAAAPHAPAIDESALRHPLTHRGSAEHGDLAQQERSALGEIDIDMPRHLRAVEQDGFLRQPGQMRAIRDLQRDVELGGLAGRAINLLRGRRGQASAARLLAP